MFIACTATYQMIFFAQILEGRSFKLKYPWVGVVNRSQADINKNVDMIAARKREREYFSNTTEYRHLAHKMGSEHLAKMLSKVCAFTGICVIFFTRVLIISRSWHSEIC